jgi:hypothetical protein
LAKKKEDSVQFIKDKINEGENWYVIRQVQINRAFYNSQQWIGYDDVNRRVFVPVLRPGEKRLTFNKIKPAILTLLSKLTKNRVKLEVKPDTNDVDRIEVAKAGIKYLSYQWAEDQMDTKSRRLKMHMLIDGFPTLKVYVDKSKGKDLRIDESEAEKTQEIAQAAGIKELPQKAGKICTQVCDQFVMLTDPNAESHEEIQWAMERRPEDVNEIKDYWGKEVAPDDNIMMRQNFKMGLTSPNGVGLDIKKYKNHAIVNDFWELPCTKYPKGRRIVTAGDKELLVSEDPGEFPYIFFPAVPVPGTAIATGVVTDMTTPQRSYNIKKTAEARILEEMGNPMWINPNGGTDDDELTNEIGGIIHSAGETLPQRVQGVEPGNSWQAAMDRDEADMEDISGAHEISQGATPKGNNTLGGLQLQVEQDETKIALLVQSYEEGMKKWGEKVLRLVQKHFPEEQQLSIVGENGEIEAFTFSGADLTGGEVVDVIPGSSMPTLKAVQDEKIMAMWGAGMFNDPNTGQPDSRKVMRMLGESVATEYFDDTEQDENKALMEQRMWQKYFNDQATAKALMVYSQQMQDYQMAQQEAQALAVQVQQAGGQPPPFNLPVPQPPVKLPIVRDFYDHAVHIMAHNRFRKSDDYDELPPEFQAIIDQHVKEHEQYLAEPQIQAQQQAEAMAAQQAQTQAQEADKQRQNEQATKMQDHYNRMEETALKGDIALQTAAAKGGVMQ